jgi:hypothetical protein
VRLYVSGPITGYPDLNKPVFELVTETLELAGHTVLNPHVVCTLLDAHDCKGPCNPSEALLPWEDYLRADLVAMLQQADGLAMLPKWEASRGAQLEHHVATALGWDIRPWAEWL